MEGRNAAGQQPSHGTYAGWNWHMKNDKKVCAACAKASADYQKRWRRRLKCAQGLGWPLRTPDYGIR